MDGQSDFYYPLSEDKKCYALPHIYVISPRCPNGGRLQILWMDYKRLYWESLGTPIFSWDSIFKLLLFISEIEETSSTALKWCTGPVWYW